MKPFISVLLFFLFFTSVFAQEDLMDMLDDKATADTNYTTATFKSTRVMNGHSIEKMPPGQLDFRILIVSEQLILVRMSFLALTSQAFTLDWNMVYLSG